MDSYYENLAARNEEIRRLVFEIERLGMVYYNCNITLDYLFKLLNTCPLSAKDHFNTVSQVRSTIYRRQLCIQMRCSLQSGLSRLLESPIMGYEYGMPEVVRNVVDSVLDDQ